MTSSNENRTKSGQHVYSTRRQRDSGLLLRRIFGLFLPLLIIFGGVGAFVAMSAFKPKPETKEDVVKAIPVLTAEAMQESVTLSVKAQGEVQPRTEINIVPQVSGRITYMSPNFIEGGAFKKGDLLVRIEPAEFNLRVTQARASVAQAETVLVRERSEAEVARRDWDEIGTGGSPTALTLREPQMAEAAANLEAARARLAEAELQLSRTAVRAPFTGRVSMRHIDQGEFVNSGTKLGEVYSTAVMDVRLPLTNDDLRRAGLTLGYSAAANGGGIPVTLSANVAGTYANWEGRIVRTDSRFDKDTRVLYSYVEVKDPFGKAAKDGVPLAPGLFVDAAIAGRTLEDIVTVPRSALRGEVYIANSDDTLSIRQVSVLSSDRSQAVIQSGLSAGEIVITSPIRGVADGMKINVVSRESLVNNGAAVAGGAP